MSVEDHVRAKTYNHIKDCYKVDNLKLSLDDNDTAAYWSMVDKIYNQAKMAGFKKVDQVKKQPIRGNDFDSKKKKGK